MSGEVGRRGAIHGINITPLVDIFLVLLILVMVSSTLTRTQGIELRMPRAVSGEATPPSATDLLLDRRGELSLDGTPMRMDSALQVLRGEISRDPEHPILVSADAKIPYENVVEVLDLVRSSGATTYALRVRKER